MKFECAMCDRELVGEAVHALGLNFCSKDCAGHARDMHSAGADCIWHSDGRMFAFEVEDWADKSLPEDAEIKSAFPTRSGRHDLYAEAARMVSAKRSKFALIALVNMLLHRVENVRTAATLTVQTMQKRINELE